MKASGRICYTVPIAAPTRLHNFTRRGPPRDDTYINTQHATPDPASEKGANPMARLNQIIAVEKGVKSRSFQELTEAHHQLQKTTALAGIARTYRPKDEEGEQFPAESTRVQVKAEDVIRSTVAILTELFDVTATKDWANCQARADVVVDGTVLL